MKRSNFIFLLQRFYFYYGKNNKLLKGFKFDSHNKNNELKTSKIYFRSFLKKRNFYLRVCLLKNPLLLFFFNFNVDIKKILKFVFNFNIFFILNIFKVFIKVIKNVKFNYSLKLFLVKHLVTKNNKLILKSIYYFWLLNNKLRDKKEFISSFLSFVKDKKELMNSFLKFNFWTKNNKFNKLYFLSILYKIERKYSLLNLKEKNFIYSKKKRYKFISFFL
jgi:hypothetical protein